MQWRRPARPPRFCPSPHRPAAGGAWAPGRARSPAISCPHALLGGGQGKGQHLPAAGMQRRAVGPWRVAAGGRDQGIALALACNCESCCASSSSAFSRCQAGWLWSSSVASDTSGVGWCKNDSASRRFHEGWWPLLMAASRVGMVSRQVGPGQPGQHHLAQIGLRQSGHGGVDRRQRRGQLAAGRAKRSGASWSSP
jgi:hypothetical protein